MLHLIHYLIAHPMIAVGLGILVLLVLHNLRRGQPRIALGLALTICVSLFYVYRQMLAEQAEVERQIDSAVIESLAPPPLPPESPE